MEASKYSRQELANYILHIANDSIIDQIKSFLMRKDNDEDIVAHTIQGEALTRKKYNEKIKEAEQRMSDGEWTSHEDLVKELNKW